MTANTSRWLGNALRPTSALLTALLAFLSFTLVIAPAAGPAHARPSVALQEVARGLTAPVQLLSPPDDTGRRFIVDQTGAIFILTADGTLLAEPFLDLRPRFFPAPGRPPWLDLRGSFDERGLLGLAFHPEFRDNGRFFIYYSAPLRPGAPAGWNHTSRISEFRMSAADPNRADLSSERVVIEVDQPQANHNGGGIAFGPDGYLYIPLGDGGGAGDTGAGHPPRGHGQDVTTLLGSILRIDVDRDDGRGYAIPEDNPFAGGGGRPEIWAWGFRNPYRIAFDSVPPYHLFVADAGQNRWEEISIVSRPGNYGWRIKEGTHWFNPRDFWATSDRGSAVGPRGEPLIDPVVVYANANAAARDPSVRGVGLAVVGAYMYRGEAIPALQGKLVFADWSRSWTSPRGVLLVAHPREGWQERWRDPAITGEPEGPWPFEELLEVNGYVLGLGRDGAGELYVLTSRQSGPTGRTGVVYKLVPAR